jgi:hypothetical protein
MPVKPLPPHSSLDHLKYQAKDLMRQHSAREIGCAQRLREFHPKFQGATDAEIFAAELRLSDAQLAIARERGFAGWTRLKRHLEKPAIADQLTRPHHERIEDATFRHAVDLLDKGDAAGLRDLLAQHPALVRKHVLFEGGNYFRDPTLLEFIAENPVRHGVLPAKIVEVAKMILNAAPAPAAVNSALELVATGRVPREQNVQKRLIEVLCEYGANPDGAIPGAALHGETGAVHALLEQGARLSLPVAAALGLDSEFLNLLPAATAEERHLALALASQYGRADIVRALLDAGEDPNRYNPGHSHSTPLHQAALQGDRETVRLLVERGARLEMRDLIWNGTPADWARHAGWTEVEEYLRELERS